MNYQHKLQIPISQELSKKLKERAEEFGFSSVTEAVRFFLKNFVNGKLSISFVNKEEETENIDLLVREAIQEYKEDKTQKLDFSRSIHEQIMKGE